MDLSVVIIAIPMYFTLMGVELVYEAWTRKKTYRLNDAVTNISTGVLQQLTGTFFAILKVGVYAYVYEHFRLLEMGQGWLAFLGVFVLWDLCYYWDHRMAHEISLFWGGHSVHHQSEDFNLSVALRQSSTSFIWGIPFYLPMAIVGFHPTQFLLVGGLNLLYQFWIHTEHIDRMPRWFEAIFNTPSHHRVHHGRDPKYLDRNYAGVLIIWDKLFGTFQREEERPNYGITKPLQSWNPVYANFAHYIDLIGYTRKARSLGDVLRILFKPPGWLPDYMGGREQITGVQEQYEKYNTSISARMNLYILVQFLVALGLNAYYFFSQGDFLLQIKIGYALWIVFTTLIFGFLFERRSVLLATLELLRLISIPLGLYLLGSFPQWVLLLSTAFSLGSIAVFLSLYRHTRRYTHRVQAVQRSST